MNPFFNDDDLKGNRRSVLIASSIVFALYFAEFRSDEISLFGLRVVVSQTSIIIGVKFVLLYLISVFCLGVFGYVTQLERDRILDVGRELEQRYDLWKTAIRKATKHLDNANKDQPLGATEYLSSMDRGIRRVASTVSPAQ